MGSCEDARPCSCACAQQLRGLSAAVEQLRSDVRHQEQALGRVLATVVPAVEAISIKMERRRPAVDEASGPPLGRAGSVQLSTDSSAQARASVPAPFHVPGPTPAAGTASSGASAQETATAIGDSTLDATPVLPASRHTSASGSDASTTVVNHAQGPAPTVPISDAAPAGGPPQEPAPTIGTTTTAAVSIPIPATSHIPAAALLPASATADAAATSTPGADTRSALLAAASSGDAGAVRRLLQRARGDADARAGPLTRDARGDSALHRAAASGHAAALHALLQAAGADFPQETAWAANTRGHGFRRPLHAAAAAGHVDAARCLLAAGAARNAQDAEGRTALHLAAANGHRDVAALLLAEGATPDAADEHAVTPLDAAALAGHAALVRLLLQAGARATGSALVHAAAGGNRDTLLALPERALDVNARDRSGRTALHAAAEGGREEVMQLLLRRGANVDAPSPVLGAPLLFAARGGHAGAVRTLLDAGASLPDPQVLMAAAAEGGSPVVMKVLMTALFANANRISAPVFQVVLENARNGDVVWALADIMKCTSTFRKRAEESLPTLAAKGNALALRAVLATGVNVRGTFSAKALQLAAENDQAECVAALLDAGVWDTQGNALCSAARVGHVRTLSVFLDRDLPDDHKNTALKVAKDHFNSAVMRMLVQAGADPFQGRSDESWDLLKCIAKKRFANK